MQTTTIPALTKQGQALLTKLATTPAQFTQQDLQTLYLVQAEQKQTLAQLQSDVSTLGGVAQLTSTCAISITQKAQ